MMMQYQLSQNADANAVAAARGEHQRATLSQQNPCWSSSAVIVIPRTERERLPLRGVGLSGVASTATTTSTSYLLHSHYRTASGATFNPSRRRPGTENSTTSASHLCSSPQAGSAREATAVAAAGGGGRGASEL